MTNQEPNQREGKLRDLLILVPYVKPHQAKLWSAVALMIVSSLVSIALPMFMREAVDTHIMAHDLRGLVSLIAIAFALIIVMTVANILRGGLWPKWARIRSVRSEMICSPTCRSFRCSSSTRSCRQTDHPPHQRCGRPADLVGNAIVAMVIDSLRLVGFLVLMFWLDWRLTVITLLISPILVYAMTFLTSRIRKAEDQVREQASLVNANLQESISGIKVIQGFQAEEHFHEQFQVENHSLLQAGMKAIATYAFSGRQSIWPGS